MEQLTVERTIWIAAPRERVWQAVTDPVQLEQWYAPGCPWEIPSLQVGAVVSFSNTDTDIQRATIDMVDSPRQLTLRWQPDSEYPAARLVTTFLLTEENSGTQVTIIEAGYETFPADIRRQRHEQTAAGYHLSLEQLKQYLEYEPDERTKPGTLHSIG